MLKTTTTTFEWKMNQYSFIFNFTFNYNKMHRKTAHLIVSDITGTNLSIEPKDTSWSTII